METIKNYLDNMFARLPVNFEVKRLKEDLLANMEEKYNELKAQGKSENEAIGIVISEFGNIDELIKELDIKEEYQEIGLRNVTIEEADQYLVARRKSGILIATGVFLCIFGVSMMILISSAIAESYRGMSSALEILGLVVLFIFIAIAVGLFIFAGISLEKYKYLSQPFNLSNHVTTYLNKKNEDFNKTFVIAIIIGVVLCILSPMVLIVISYMGNFSDIISEIGVVTLLIMIAVAVYTFIWAGCIKDSYSVLLQIGEYEKEKKEDKVISAVASIVWPLTVCAFLIWGFLFNGWQISWILFPIVGVLFGCFTATYSTLKGK